MRALLHSFSTGESHLIEAPDPVPGRNELLVRSIASVVSPGTERMLVEFGRAPLWKKALQQPERVRQVFAKAQAEGVATALEAVRARLDTPLAPGYAACGRVLALGTGVQGFAAGDLVAAAGPHAEEFTVPATLAVRVPDGVAPEHAAFATIGAIALQAVRLAEAGPGSAVGVTGLGLIGLIAAQLLRAAGCRVFGLDLDPSRVALARSFGAEAHVLDGASDPAPAAERFSRGRGLDAVIVATAGGGAGPLRDACRMARPRGKIVLLGTATIDLPRDLLYRKELSVVVSSSYGPGRHDAEYASGTDWPVEALRWTAGRNIEAFLDLVAVGAVSLDALIQARVAFGDAAAAYGTLDAGTLGLVLEHPTGGTAPPPQPSPARGEGAHPRAELPLPTGERAGVRGRSNLTGLAIIGAGNFATRTLIPNLLAAGATPRVVVSAKGVTAAIAREKFGFAQAASDLDAALDDSGVGIVAIATPHHTHGGLAVRALQAGKAVWVEKPLALTLAELDAIETMPGPLMVGFNRRLAPDTLAALALLAKTPGPRAITILVAAPALPVGHWLADPAIGGGALLGEGCHFIDLACCLAGGLPTTSHAAPSRAGGAISLSFADGSTASIHYFAGSHRSVPKERIEVAVGGRTLRIENFRRLVGHGFPGAPRAWWARARPDKGHVALARKFVSACRDGTPLPVAREDLLAVSRLAVQLAAPPFASG
jgi:predicted dehydrogenase/NADPH:quinone reductase-like Zn-dependent oxidoreductase